MEPLFSQGRKEEKISSRNPRWLSSKARETAPPASFNWRCPFPGCEASIGEERLLLIHLDVHRQGHSSKRSEEMGGPLLAEEAEDEAKMGEMWAQFPQEEPPGASVPMQPTSNKMEDKPLSEMPPEGEKFSAAECSCGKAFPNKTGLLKHCALFEGLPHFFCKACTYTAMSSDFEEHQKSKLHESRMKKLNLRERRRPFPDEAGGGTKYRDISNEQSLYSEMSLLPWEEMERGQNDEDSMLQIGAEDTLEEEYFGEGHMGTLPFEEPTGEPFVGELPFTFFCSKCGAGFYLFCSLQSHMDRLHPGLDPLWCHFCDKKYRLPGAFYSHMLKMHGLAQPEDHPGGYECDECGGHFPLRENYASHCQFFRGKPHFFCKPRNKALLIPEWGRHKRTPPHAAEGYFHNYSCQDCGKEYLHREDFEEHRERLWEKPHVFCKPCQKVLDQEEWESHQKTRGHKIVKIHFYCCNVIIPSEDWGEHQMMTCHKEHRGGY